MAFTFFFLRFQLQNEARAIRTPNRLIWSQTRYRCAIAPPQGRIPKSNRLCSNALMTVVSLRTTFFLFAKTPTVGLEPTTTSLKGWRSTD